jgi:hypothetical protein
VSDRFFVDITIAVVAWVANTASMSDCVAITVRARTPVWQALNESDSEKRLAGRLLRVVNRLRFVI